MRTWYGYPLQDLLFPDAGGFYHLTAFFIPIPKMVLRNLGMNDVLFTFGMKIKIVVVET
ncbi:hypothetical protein [Calothrix sp. NIES-3974]|uniref:hypothetical protein n=1 Tax=Calothrix sp. NIES-3974 TaxID=2005462 RepID=UPI0012FDB05A|nr:hypothetical protein [Calothrix sp. NIES-3974]